jgi:Tfp pilus assembly protein PilW
MKRGYSLIELLLYVGLSATIISAVAVFFYFVSFTKTKIQTITEVENEGQMVVEIISQNIRNAQKVNLPNLGESGEVLSLQSANPNEDPIVFSLENGRIKMQKGSSLEFFLTSDRLEVTNLTFRNLSNATSRATIRAEFSIRRKNPTQRAEFSWQKNFYTTANLRI